MYKLLKLPIELILSRGMTVIQTPDRANAIITEWIASVIPLSPLFVIAGSSWMPAFALTSLIDKNAIDVGRALKHLYTARASTCLELFDSLASRRSNGEAILVLDFLHSFDDSEVPLSNRLLRFSQCCRELQRLAFYRPVTVITAEAGVESSDDFIDILNSIADSTFSLKSEVESANQIVLI